MLRKSLLLLTAAAIGMVSSASAQSITSIDVLWANASPGSVSIDNSNPDAISVCWPHACSASGNSSYLFERSGTPITPGLTPFALGTFTHLNFPISGTALSSVDLLFTYAIGGATPPTFSDSWTLSHEETPNSGTCPYPSDTPCSDRVTFALTSGGSPTPFDFGGNSYTVTVLGFGATSSAADLQPFFITQENQENPTTLWAQIEAVNPPSTVPEPATMTLLATGLVALGASKRRRKS